MSEKLAESEKLIAELNQSWEEKLAKTQELQHERERMLEEIGVALKTTDKGAIGARCTGARCRAQAAAHMRALCSDSALWHSQ